MKENNILIQNLLELIQDGTLDMGMLLNQVNDMQNNKYLKKHNYAIWQNKDGKHVTEILTKGGKRKQISSVTREGLEKKIIDYYKSLDDSPTSEDTFNKWINEKLDTDIAKGTCDRYTTDFYRFFDEEFRTTKMRDFTEKQIATYIKHTIRNQSLSYKAYSGMRTILMGILKYSKANGLSDISATSLFDGLELNKRNFTKILKPDGSQIYTEEDLNNLIEYLGAETEFTDYALAILFLIRTGLRIGELGALKKIDVNEDSILVRRQYISHKGDKGHRIYEIVEYAKSSAGLREVILTDKAKDIIQKTCARHPDNEFLFTCEGRLLTSSVCNNYLRNACKALGIPYRSVHKLRKTFATILLDNGVDEAYVKAIMGHEDINTTRSHYYYCNKKKKDYEAQIKSAIII